MEHTRGNFFWSSLLSSSLYQRHFNHLHCIFTPAPSCVFTAYNDCACNVLILHFCPRYLMWSVQSVRDDAHYEHESEMEVKRTGPRALLEQS